MHLHSHLHVYSIENMVDTSGYKHSMTFYPVCNGADRYDHKYILTSYPVWDKVDIYDNRYICIACDQARNMEGSSCCIYNNMALLSVNPGGQ